MNDMKSKLPDLNELTSMATKLYQDVKASVGEIVEMYKEKRTSTETAHEEETEKTTKNTDDSKHE